MDKVLEYRIKHPRCRYCKYFYIFSPKGPFSYIELPQCKLKDKYLRFYFEFRNIKGALCNYFENKEKD